MKQKIPAQVDKITMELEKVSRELHEKFPECGFFISAQLYGVRPGELTEYAIATHLHLYQPDRANSFISCKVLDELQNWELTVKSRPLNVEVTWKEKL